MAENQEELDHSPFREETTFKSETVMKLVQRNFKDPKTKMSREATELTTELLRIFVKEAALRSTHQAKDESSVVVEQKHLEKILPQLIALPGLLYGYEVLGIEDASQIEVFHLQFCKQILKAYEYFHSCARKAK